LVTAFVQATNNPVVVSVEPEKVTVQEIKVMSPASTSGSSGTSQQAPAKSAKVVDVVAIRHEVASPTEDKQNRLRTTLILLCEDGSLKIYVANAATEYWLSGKLGPQTDVIKG